MPGDDRIDLTGSKSLERMVWPDINEGNIRELHIMEIEVPAKVEVGDRSFWNSNRPVLQVAYTLDTPVLPGNYKHVLILINTSKSLSCL